MQPPRGDGWFGVRIRLTYDPRAVRFRDFRDTFRIIRAILFLRLFMIFCVVFDVALYSDRVFYFKSKLIFTVNFHVIFCIMVNLFHRNSTDHTLRSSLNSIKAF